MASIQTRQKNGRPSYTVKVRLKGYPSVFATFERLTDARRWASKTETEMREGRYFQKSKTTDHTFSQVLERFYQDIVPNKPNLSKQYKQQLDWWNDEIGDISIRDLKTSKLCELRDQLASEITNRGMKRTPATVNRYLAAASSLFGIAFKEWGWIDENPILKVKKLKEPRGRVRMLSDTERSRLLEASLKDKNPDIYLIIVLALSTGARRMEIWSLVWTNIDLERGMIILHETKNDDRRSLPLQSHAHELMQERYKIRRTDTDLVFPSNKNPFVPFDFRVPFQRVLQNAFIEDFRFHDLRHSAASYLAMSGATLSEIAAVLGHKTLSMVKRYSHITDQHTSNVVKKMNMQIFE
tara:strand:- start:255 stop:1313 length:1059 start_codon:yes stop_codon:yes gene_type:complete